MSEETVYLKTDGILVTNTRVVISNKTYSMANITSVSMHTLSPVKTLIYLLVGLGGFVALAGIFAGITAPGDIITKLIIILIGIGMIGIGFYWNKRQYPSYLVRFGSASGETEVLKSKNRAMIDNLVEAINNAIIDRG